MRLRKLRLGPAVLIALLALAFAQTAAETEGPVTLRFELEEGKVLSYKGSSRTDMNWSGMDLAFINGHEVEVSLLEKLENENCRVSVSYMKATNKMMRSGKLQDWDSPIKPEGRTVKVEVTPRGEVIEALGFIMGVKKGRQLDNFVDRWFFELPEEPIEKGSTWTVDIDESSEEGDDEEFQIKGTVEYKVKKFGKKKGIEVVEIEGEAKLDIHSVSAQGTFDGKSKSKIKGAIALEGGYVVEMSRRSETKGKMVSDDPATGKVNENDVARVESDEIKLEK
jgi:hypothetical protein